MTSTVERPPTNGYGDPYLSIKQLCEMYPFMRSEKGNPARRIYRKRDLGHFPKEDGRNGRELLWRQSTIEAWLADGMVGLE